MEMNEIWEKQAAYNAWMNSRLYELCSALSDEDRKADQGAFFGSVHNTLAHLLLTDLIWMRRLTGDHDVYRFENDAGELVSNPGLDTVLYEDFSKMWARRVTLDEQISEWVKGLEPGAAGRDVGYANMSGKTFSHPLWWAVTHLFNHQTHHRGQLTTLLAQMGQDFGTTDLIAHLRINK